MTEIRLTPEKLSARWSVPLATLSQWRWNGKGPPYLKLGKHISYCIEDVEAFERANLRQDTACMGDAAKGSVFAKDKITHEDKMMMKKS